jgi:L-rhamnose isomerase
MMQLFPTNQQNDQAYYLAKERFDALGVDTEAALATLSKIPLSLHCWQGDDVGGFENPD